MFIQQPDYLYYVESIIGALQNVTDNRLNASLPHLNINPQGLEALMGGLGDFDAGGAGVVGGQSPPPSDAFSGIGGSGANDYQVCMTDEQLNAYLLALFMAIAAGLGLDADPYGSGQDPSDNGRGGSGAAPAGGGGSPCGGGSVDTSMNSLTDLSNTNNFTTSSLTDLGYVNPATSQAAAASTNEAASSSAAQGTAISSSTVN